MLKFEIRAEARAASIEAALAHHEASLELAAHDLHVSAVPDGCSFAAQPEIIPHGEFMRDLPGNVDALAHRHHAEIAGTGAILK